MKLIEEHGSQAKFIAGTGENQGAISGILNRHRPFGERKARALERKIGKPYGWFDKRDVLPQMTTYMDRLSSDEMQLLHFYRSVDEEKRKYLLDLAYKLQEASFKTDAD